MTSVTMVRMGRDSVIGPKRMGDVPLPQRLREDCQAGMSSSSVSAYGKAKIPRMGVAGFHIDGR